MSTARAVAIRDFLLAGSCTNCRRTLAPGLEEHIELALAVPDPFAETVMFKPAEAITELPGFRRRPMPAPLTAEPWPLIAHFAACHLRSSRATASRFGWAWELSCPGQSSRWSHDERRASGAGIRRVPCGPCLRRVSRAGLLRPGGRGRCGVARDTDSALASRPRLEPGMVAAVKHLEAPAERPILFSGAMVRGILAGQKTQTRRVMTKPRVYLPGAVRSDFAIPDGAIAPRGTYAAHMNPHGAVSVVAKDGRLLGVKPGEFDFVCPYAAGRTYLDGGWRIDVEAGSRLWVRETWRPDCRGKPGESDVRGIHYRADDNYQSRPRDLMLTIEGRIESPWRPSIFMPRWASRITLEVTEVRVQRVLEISEEDAKAEGCPGRDGDGHRGAEHPTTQYEALWDSINAKRGYSWESNPFVWAITFRRLA